ncbi:hypothetical protein QN277_026316 [Acacia crassicarpa]|uniref:MAPK kinase substrate protein n=1 Tax=Acacia crassicarpa TaxID=499986 RepID=A0AAE1J7M0_9FABA|nr:hypothetical protein QN277_026316 [Acacia crassicarpa]
MAELQRSVTSFRRQGSSGLVWKDKFLSASQGHNHPNNHHQQPPNPAPHRSRSAGGQPYGAVNITLPPKHDGAPPYQAVNITPHPKEDPPSPKVPTCGLCGIFGKQPVADHRTTSKSKKRR